MTDSFFQYREHVEFSQEKANKVPLGVGDHSRTTLWCLLPGQGIKPHVHAGDHVWVVLEGEGEFLTETDTASIRPGTVLTAPAGESHGVTNSSTGNLVFLSISAG
ncbi:MAG: cupin [Desulfuromonas sp.]|nr:MAG: cupin [Desulfuromonas sp.]